MKDQELMVLVPTTSTSNFDPGNTSTKSGLMKRDFYSRTKPLLIITLVFMALGTGAELILISHYEGTWQLIPIIIIGLSLLCFLTLQWRKSSRLIKLFKVLMMASILSGFLGTWLHLRANMEFESEMRASASSWDVFTSSLSGALPTLAPGSMIVFGLIGLLYTLITLNYKNENNSESG